MIVTYIPGGSDLWRGSLVYLAISSQTMIATEQIAS